MTIQTVDLSSPTDPQFAPAFAAKANTGDLPIIGSYTVATLPPAAANQAKYAYVTNLGGGADMVLSDGIYWKHIRRGKVSDIAAATTVTVTPLLSPTILNITGTSVAGLTGSIKIDGTNLYPGYDFTLVIAGALGVGTTLGLSLATGGGITTLLGGSWYDLQFDGTKLVKLRGSSLI